MSDKFESQHSLSPTIWSDILVGHFGLGRTWEWILKDFFLHFSRWIKNTLGYLRTRTFYTPERKYAYKYASITKCLTWFYLHIYAAKYVYLWILGIGLFRPESCSPPESFRPYSCLPRLSIIYLLHGIVHLMSGVTHMENDLLFC
jgi:hypothetical protein